MILKFPIFHICSICGKKEEWNDNWSWFGSIKDIDDGNDIVKVCSDICKSKFKSIGGENGFKKRT